MGLPKNIIAEHVWQAIGYMKIKGEQDKKHGILYVRSQPDYLAVVYEGESFGVKEVLKVAYCFAIDEKPDENQEFTENQLELLGGTMRSAWNSHMARDYLIKLGFKLRDYEHVILFNISNNYKDDMTAEALYEATRGTWKVGVRAYLMQYAFAVAKGIIREVYEIDSWHTAGTTIEYKIRPELNNKDISKKEFCGTVANGIRDKYINRRVDKWGQIGFHYQELKKLTNTTESESEETMTNVELELLEQFYQIIFYGPPGTGKTYGAKKLLEELFGVDANKLHSKEMQKRWDIVQFHPSYNYEDFVRGVKVETKKGEVVYKTVDKVFGKICKRANADKSNKYALIIDEINRANVSAVLGELIYALEYRGEEISTPYKVGNSQMLTIPKNLLIIGTMNTADRTIGQIDYAVRRRFAFVPCLPNRKIIDDEINNEKVLGIYDKVQDLFGSPPSVGYLSQDFDAKDVRIGHSYFLAEGQEFVNKIVYQVIPILREYVKDGVLTDGAKKDIKIIEKEAKKLFADESVDLSADDVDEKQDEGGYIFFWKAREHSKFDRTGKTTLGIVKSYVEHYSPKNLEELSETLSLPPKAVRSISEDESKNTNKEHQITLADGNQVAVNLSWAGNKPYTKDWKSFVDSAEKLGYEIKICSFVNIGEGERRSWQDCAKYNFVAAGGSDSLIDRNSMEKLKKGDYVFAYRGGKGVHQKKGFIAFGRVIETAVSIHEFKVANGRRLSICRSVKGGLYKGNYPTAFGKFCDYAVRIKWKEILSEDKIIEMAWTKNIVRKQIKDFLKFREAFNLDGGESDE